MAAGQLLLVFVLAIILLYIQIGLVTAYGNSTEADECNDVGDLSLDGWGTEGVVLMCYDSGSTLKWGVVCNNEWDDIDAKVSCRALGYDGKAKAVPDAATTYFAISALFKDGIMDNVNCIGNETSLTDCQHESSCPYSYYMSLAAVRCNVETLDNGVGGGGGFDGDFDNDRFDNDNDWDHDSYEPRNPSTVIIIVVIGIFVSLMTVIVRCYQKSKREARLQLQMQTQNFEMGPPSQHSAYPVGQHPPPNNGFQKAQQMYPPNISAAGMMPSSHSNPYPTGAQPYPPPAGMPPAQPYNYPSGAQPYPPPAELHPAQPYPYLSGAQPYPTPAGMPPAHPPPYQTGAQPHAPPNEMVSLTHNPNNGDTIMPNCPPPAYDDAVKID